MQLRRVFLVALLFPSIALAESTLDIQNWLSRPGVRAVAVEFYATWCQPCMEAMPRWQKLKDQFGPEGLRVIVVNTQDPTNNCVPPKWPVDGFVCDLQGTIAERFGVGSHLPSALLWSWQGDLLVRSGHITEIERGVEKSFATSPRVTIEAGPKVSASTVALLRERLADSGKVLVVADEAERASIQAAKLKSLGDHFAEDKRCEIGRELPPNALLKVEVIDAGGTANLALSLLDLEKGCQKQASTAPWTPQRPSDSVREAVENLLQKLRRSAVEYPEGTVEVSRQASIRTGTLVISSNIDGAQLSVDGVPRPDLLGRAALSLDVKAGEHRVRVAKNGYLDDLRNVTITAGRSTTFEANLVAEPSAPKVAPRATDTTALLQVETQPSGAVLLIDGRPMGKAPASFELPPGKHEIRARLNWYREAVETVELVGGKPRGKLFELEADFGKLEVTAAQRGVSIALDDRTEGVADPVLKRSPLAPGEYRLRASLPEHHDHVETVTIRAGAEVTRVSVPALRSALGSLQISTQPVGATVRIDGQERGKSPLRVDRLSGGSHELVVELARYGTVEQPVEVIDGQVSPVSVKLEPRFSTLRIMSEPVSGTVSVDGNRIGTAPQTVEVDEGDHVVRVEADTRAYRPWEGRVTAVRKMTAAVEAKLEPIYGTLLVTTTPFAARVQLDGKPEGETPLQVDSILGGPHRYRVEKAGFRVETGTVEVRGNEKNRLDLRLVELLPEERARLRVAAWEEQTAPDRNRATLRTILAVGGGALAAVGGWQWWNTRQVADTAWTTYVKADASTDDLYADYQSKHWTSVGWGAAAVAGAVGGVWSAWSASAIRKTIPARPVFEIQPAGASAGVQGEW